MKAFRLVGSFLAVLLLLAILVMAPQAAHAKKVALIIGISDYQTMRDQSDKTSNAPIGDLRGAVNDAKWIRQVIMDRYGFKTEDIKILLDAQATKADVMDAMNNWLIKQVENGDMVLVYISGHGTQVLSHGADPNELWDQAFVCYDYAPVSSAANAPAAKRNIVIDNDFGKMFDELSKKTDKITMIADCCYSGSMSRDPLPGFYSAKWIPATKADMKKAKDVPAAPAVMSDVEDKVTFIGACADVEQASEAEMQDGKWHGAMSYYLIKALEQGSRNMNYEDLISELKTQIQSKFRQTPQLSSKHPEWPVLGGAEKDVVAQAPNPPAAQPVAITPVGGQPPTTSAAQNLRGDILYVKVVGNKALSDSLDAIPNVDIATTNGTVDRIVVVTSRGGKLKADLTMRDGVVDAVVPGTSDDEIASALRPFLQKAWLIKLVSCARSADPDMEPQIQINSEMPKNLSIKPVQLANPGLPSLYTGGTVAFTVKPSKPCYLTLVDIGTDGSMSVLLPNKIYSESTKLNPGQNYQVPSPDMGFEIGVEPPVGVEMVVAIATQQPLNWSSVSLAVDESRGGIASIKNTEDGSRLFMVKPKANITVTTTTTTTVTSQDGLLPSEGFGIAYVMAEVKAAK